MARKVLTFNLVVENVTVESDETEDHIVWVTVGDHRTVAMGKVQLLMAAAILLEEFDEMPYGLDLLAKLGRDTIVKEA